MEKFVPNANKNLLLVKDDVGRAKPTTRHLPPDGFTFGRSERKDCEGAGEVTSSWSYHNGSKPKEADKDFKKLNKIGVHNKVTSAKAVNDFRKDHDVRMALNEPKAAKQVKIPE